MALRHHHAAFCALVSRVLLLSFLAPVISLPVNYKLREPDWLALASRDRGSITKLDRPHIPRPHHGGAPETVDFGIYVKDFYGVVFKEGKFTVDIVIALRWFDPRTKRLSGGNFSQTLSRKDALSYLWMPDISVTNRDVNGLEEISTSFILNPNGTVTKIQRVLVRVKTEFRVIDFPFDQQILPIRIGSSKYMTDELVLQPSELPGFFGVEHGIFGGREFHFVAYSKRSFIDQDAMNVKSRGELGITVKRITETYWSDLFFPECLVLSLAWTAFFFPLSPPFAMPRVGTSTLVMLTQMTISNRIASMMPPSGRIAWSHAMDETCNILVIFSMLLNWAILYTMNTPSVKDLAVRINIEGRMLYPVLACLVLAMLVVDTDGDDVPVLSICTRSVFALAISGYLCLTAFRVAKMKEASTATP